MEGKDMPGTILGIIHVVKNARLDVLYREVHGPECQCLKCNNGVYPAVAAVFDSEMVEYQQKEHGWEVRRSEAITSIIIISTIAYWHQTMHNAGTIGIILSIISYFT